MNKKIPKVLGTSVVVGALTGIAGYLLGKRKHNPDKYTHNKRVLILVNHDVVIYNFRLELVERLLSEGYEVHISSPYGERIDDLIKIGAKYHEISIDRHGVNALTDGKLIFEYINLIRTVKPSVILSYTIKPNIYGGIAASICHKIGRAHV